MELSESGEGEHGQGRSAAEAASAGEFGTGRESGVWSLGGPAGRAAWILFPFSGGGPPGEEAFVLREGAVPASFSPAPLCGPSALPAPERARPRPPALPAAGRDRGPAEPRALSWPPGAAPGRGASAAAARAPGLAGSRARASWLRALRGDAAFSGKVGAPDFFRDLVIFPFVSRLSRGSCWALLARACTPQHPVRVSVSHPLMLRKCFRMSN